MIDDIILETKTNMDKAITALQHNLSKLRTGRASLVMLDGIKVDYYGTLTPLNQVATLAIPEARMITIQPWESTIIGVIEKSIEKANIGLNPTNDGKLIRLPIPQLTEERRKEIVKQLKTFGEDCRVAIRQARKEANDLLKKLKKDSDISEDDMHKGTDQVQKVTDGFISKIDETVATKEVEIMTL
ncbi:MAG: ribosome recycling factor [bacterium]|nr:ribosome recycling factor [bacterium]MBU1917420.1 ribosome recycling factor [bacterium]